jgi:hypothetical protein
MMDIEITMLGRLDPIRLHEFVDVLVKHGCPRDIAHRHAETLMSAHQKTTRVRPWVKLDELRVELDAIGIALQ